MRQRSGLLLLGTVMLGGCTMLADMKCEYVHYAADAGPDAGPDADPDADPDAGPDAAVCTPGETRFCYTGPEGTEENSPCKKGTQACEPQGSGFGPCMGEVKPAAEDCSTGEVDESCDKEAKCTGTPQWSGQLGEGLMREALDVAIDSKGDIVLTGYVNGIEGFGASSPLSSAGDGKIFVAKYPASGGEPLWYKVFDGDSGQVGNSVSTDSKNNIVVTGSFTGVVNFGDDDQTLLASEGLSDIFVVKLDASGKHVWSDSFGSNSLEFGHSVAIDSGDNIVLTGSQGGNVDFGGGPLPNNGDYDVFVVKLDPSGTHLWSKVFGSVGVQYGRGVAIGSEDAVILVGDFTGEVEFKPPLLTNPDLNATDIFVAKFDSSGGTLWSNQLGGGSSQHGTSVATDSAGDIVLTGSIASQVNFGCGALDYTTGETVIAVKLDGVTGGCGWNKSFDGTITDKGTSVAIDGAGNVVLTGHFSGPVKFENGPLPNAGDRDIFLAKLDPNGTPVWSKPFGGLDDDVGNSVATDGVGNIVLTGQFRGTVNFESKVLTSPGKGDIFVAKFAP